MRHLSFKVGTFGIALLVLFALSAGFADDFSDFEKLLQEAIPIKSDNTSAESKSKATGKTDLTPPRNIGSSTAKEPQPGPGSPARTTTTKPTNPNAPGSQKGNINIRAAKPEVISDGWTTITPNAPGLFVPEPKVSKNVETLTPPAKFAAKASQAKPFAESEELDEPETLNTEDKKFSAAKTESESLIPKGLFDEDEFDVEIEVIENEADVIESESEFDSHQGSASTRKIITNVEDSETITEPKKVGESKKTVSSVPAEKNELNDLLDTLASEQISEGSNEDSDGDNVPENPAVPEKTQVTVSVPDFDSDDDETVWNVIDANQIGDPYAKDKLKLMYEEVLNGLRTRNITNRYEMWKSYSKKALRDTAGINTGSELDGRCRLTWYQKLYAEPVQSVFEVEEYSRLMYVGFSGGHRHLAELMPGIRERMDVPKREDVGIRFPLCTTPLEALNEVKRCLLTATSAHARAFSTLTSAELTELEKNFVNTFVGNGCINGHTIPARSVGRKHVDILERVDKAALYDAAEALIPLTNTALLDLLDQLPEDALPQVMMNGQKFQRLSTAAGDIIVGGRGNNVYDLDSPEMREVICVISPGGNDTYREGTCDLKRPVLVIIDLHGNNTFSGMKPGIQGGSVMGISMLLDRDGNSTYEARDIAQGSSLGGVGILINYAGSNTYKGLRRVQGHALSGLGMLIDKGSGNASYKASLWAQGFGAPGGFGVIHNTGGNNHYYCGGLYLDSYPEHPGYDGWGQGIGAGIRQVANGGVGVLLSGEGDDVYEVDYFGHGGGYWLGVGIARDFGGNDQRHGTTLQTYDGRQRVPGNGTQSKWTRFANGFGCHYSLGYCFDDGGDDLYGGMIMGTGMAWDLAFGILCDFKGSGKYTATGNMTQGVGAEGSIGILFSYSGDDHFASRSQGYANPGITYHPAGACGGNFSFLINYGGNDKYGSGASNNSYAQRGSIGGFLIDRPTEKEATKDIIALRQAIEARNQEIVEYDAMVAQMKEEAAAKGRRYVPPRQRRPQPISESQLIGSVPDFGPIIMRADSSETNVK